MDLLWFMVILCTCYLMIIFSQGVAAWLSQLLLEEKVCGFGF